MSLPVHVCLLTHPHGEHDWWYTSSGGGHMLDSYDDTGREKNQKQWHCPGVVEAQPEPDKVPCDCATTGRIWCCMPDRHTQDLTAGYTTTEYAIRWESGEMLGPIGPNEAHGHMRDQNPGNPKTMLTRTVTYAPWREAP